MATVPMKPDSISLKQRVLPVLTVLAAVMVLWYAGCVGLNSAGVRSMGDRLPFKIGRAHV